MAEGCVLRVVLGDQLSHGIAALRGMAAGDVVLLAEVAQECTYVRHHAQKIVLVLSAMRHFAAELRARGVAVDYVTLDDPLNTQRLDGEIARAAARHAARAVVVTHPGEWRVLRALRELEAGCAVEIREDDRFLCSIGEFAAWAGERRGLRMEFFYRDMRRRTGLLMQMDGEPVDGRWNFDKENRKKLPAGMKLPKRMRFAPDAVTQEVMALVGAWFPAHVGRVEDFAWPVTAAEAEAAAAEFFAVALAGFGDWQDAMAEGAPFLFHSLLAPALNLGLLDPLDLCKRAEAAFEAGAAPLAAVEGFIRQIIGWREFVRGIYWLKMPGYARLNALGADRRLPGFYWTGETGMACMRAAIRQTIGHAYAHHIQRLMLTGNFALLAGLDPAEVDEWYLAVYADAYEWVEMPNTRGMALFADGGIVGSKPYAASGAYISRMSDHCGGCRYDVKDATGPRGCPFNALYWDFMARHAERFAANPRMAMPLRTLARMTPARVAALRARAADVLEGIERL